MNEFSKYFNKTSGLNDTLTLNKLNVEVSDIKQVEDKEVISNDTQQLGGDDYVDEHNNNLNKSNSKIEKILHDTEAEAKAGSKVAALETEYKIREYDLSIKSVRKLSLSLLIKSLVVAFIIGLISDIYAYGILNIVDCFKEVISEVLTESIRLIITWLLIMSAQWLNRHKMKSYWPKAVVFVLFFIPIVLLVVFVYNNYLYYVI